MAGFHCDCPAMPSSRFILVFAALALLAACDDSPKPEKTPSVPPVHQQEPAPPPAPSVDTSETSQTPEKLPAPGKKVIVEETLPRPEDAKPKPAAKVSVQEPLPAAKLDLHVPPEVLEQIKPTEPLEALPDQPLLPEMFAEKPKEPGPFELNGRLITNDHGDKDNYWDTVEGAELQFKFRN